MLLYLWLHKNIERHTAHITVSWPNPKQWVMVYTSDLMMIIRQSIYILSIITREMGIVKTHSPHIAKWLTERICLNFLTHSTKYISRTFHKFKCQYQEIRYVCEALSYIRVPSKVSQKDLDLICMTKWSTALIAGCLRCQRARLLWHPISSQTICYRQWYGGCQACCHVFKHPCV